MTRTLNQDTLSPGLYIVATPIGNLGDITLRAVDILGRCDVIACEDTRIAGKLLHHLGISKPLHRYNDHSDADARQKLVEMMHNCVVALISDAGTPLISDPGFRLVGDALKAGAGVTSLPGPCAAIAGLTISGLPTDRFMFAGFMPAKDKARRDVIEELQEIETTLVFYETGPRLAKTLAVLGDMIPDRDVVVTRELTKFHEERRSGAAGELYTYYIQHPPKGEMVLIIGPPVKSEVSAEDTDTLLLSALAHSKPSQAAGQVAKATGQDRKTLYARALELRKS